MLEVKDFENAPVILSYRDKRAFLDGLASFVYSFFVKWLFPVITKGKIRDLQNGLKLFSPDFLKSYFRNHLIVDISFSFDNDLILYAICNKFSIEQFQIKWTERKHGSRNFTNVYTTMKTVLRKRFKKNLQSYQFLNKKYMIDEDRRNI